MIDLTELQQATWDNLKLAREGKEITGRQLARSVGLKPRSPDKDGADMRSVINALRVKEYPVCANTKGYYVAKEKHQINEYCESLQGRIKQMEIALRGLRASQPIFELEKEEGVWKL